MKMPAQEMTDTSKVYRDLMSLSIYRGVLGMPVTSVLAGFFNASSAGNAVEAVSAWGELAKRLADSGNMSVAAAVFDELLTDENIFTVACAKGGCVSAEIDLLVCRDLDILYRIPAFFSAATARYGLPPVDVKTLESPFDRPWSGCAEYISGYHRANGVGKFIKYNAFAWESGRLNVIAHPDPVKLTDLKEYEYQRSIAVNNTRAFVQGFACNNILFYGDRGTGKSSTVKALLNEYACEGLRMIEMQKRVLGDLPELTAYLASLPMKFIIFIDDLTFSGGEDDFSALKAVLEGGLASRPSNVLIYATSNRRHLLRESFSDRGSDEINRADTMQESASLSDRFGICLTFLMPDKQRFLNIVEQMAIDERIDVPRQKLLNAAEQWALERGARSPRFARQFINDFKAGEGTLPE